MRVLHVVRRYAPLVGGTERYVNDLARTQASLGHDVTVVTLDRDVTGTLPGRLPPQEECDGVEIVRLPGLGGPRWAVTARPDRLAGLAGRADAVHLHDLRFQVGLAAISVLARRRLLILHTHGLLYHTAAMRRAKDLAMRAYYGPVLHAVNAAVICDSEADQSELRRVVPSLADRSRLLRDAVDLKPFLNIRRAPVSGRIVVVGRLAPSKGIDRLFRAVAAVRAQPWFLELHGAEEPGERDRLQGLAEVLRITDRVRFHGTFESGNEPEILSTAALAVFPSRGEGFGIALLDAMAAGVPILASDLPAHRQLLGDLADFLIVDFDDEDVAGPRLLESLDNGERVDLGGPLRERAKEYDVMRLAAEIDGLYRSERDRRSASIHAKNGGSSQR